VKFKRFSIVLWYDTSVIINQIAPSNNIVNPFLTQMWLSAIDDT